MKRSISSLGKPLERKRVCAVLALCAAAIPLQAQTFNLLHSFDASDGENPEAGLVQATNGELYGSVHGGGTGAEGTIFRIANTGGLTTMYTFCSQSACADGAGPGAALIQAPDGNLYGTTSAAGANSFYAEYGTVFTLSPTGALTTLYSFCSQPNCTDGAGPTAGLVRAANGDYYGTTGAGGVNVTCFLGCGTVFKINSASLTTLHNFCSQPNCADGSSPEAGLIQANDGNLYGTTSNGGTNDEGTIFRITLAGALTTVYTFCSQTNCADGADPVAGLVQGINGDLYGTTKLGGSNCVPHGCGTLFKISLSGELTTLHSFCAQANCADGQYPSAGLIQATDKNFYGTTEAAGANSSFEQYGTLFSITPSGNLTTVHSFCSQAKCADGAAPVAALVQSTDGNFYGTTLLGGTYGSGAGGWGTVFKLSVGLAPFVKTGLSWGKAGDAVQILGTDLTQATAVTFNRTPAIFTVNSSSLITATVPAGATSGEVLVVTPQSDLVSNLPFRVLP